MLKSTDERLFIKIADLSFDSMNVSSSIVTRLETALQNDNLNLVGDVLNQSKHDLMRIPNFGKKCFELVEETFAFLGLKVGRDTPEQWPATDQIDMGPADIDRIKAAVARGTYQPGQLELKTGGTAIDINDLLTPEQRGLFDDQIIEIADESIKQIAKQLPSGIISCDTPAKSAKLFKVALLAGHIDGCRPVTMIVRKGVLDQPTVTAFMLQEDLATKAGFAEPNTYIPATEETLENLGGNNSTIRARAKEDDTVLYFVINTPATRARLGLPVRDPKLTLKPKG